MAEIIKRIPNSPSNVQTIKSNTGKTPTTHVKGVKSSTRDNKPRKWIGNVK